MQALARMEAAVAARIDRAEASKAHFRAEATLLSRLGPVSRSEGRRADEDREVTEEATYGTLNFLDSLW